MISRLNVGLVGLGRMGRVYVANLAQLVPNARLVAVADAKPELAEEIAQEYGVPKSYGNHHDLLDDKNVTAVIIVTPTSQHATMVTDAAKLGKAIFCEKPLSTSLQEAEQVLQAVEATKVFFQAAFQRRFDAAYVAAREKVEAGEIGTPVLLQSTSRDPYRPPLEFCDPKVSGGLIADMGIHDFDVARMFMGDVDVVHAIGGALAYPEMKPIGDIDNAVVDMVFESGALGVVQLSRNAVFGYDIRGEIWGTRGSIQIGYFRETPILVMTKQGITHDVVPYFMQRFERAYLAQIQDFVDNVLNDRPPSVTCADGMAAMRISAAATTSLQEHLPVKVARA